MAAAKRAKPLEMAGELGVVGSNPAGRPECGPVRWINRPPRGSGGGE